MTDRLLVEHNPFNGISEYAVFDNDGSLIGLQHVSDTTAIIENNKKLQNQGNKGYGETREWKHIASIPTELLIQWAVEKGVTFDMIQSKEGFENIVMKYLKDSDWRNVRVDV